MTAVRPPARFGEIIIKKNIVSSFKRKAASKKWLDKWSLFCIKTIFLKTIRGDKDILEKQPLERVCKMKELSAFKHKVSKCMDVER